MLPAAFCVCVWGAGSELAALLPPFEMKSLQIKADTGLTRERFSSGGSCKVTLTLRERYVRVIFNCNLSQSAK